MTFFGDRFTGDATIEQIARGERFSAVLIEHGVTLDLTLDDNASGPQAALRLADMLIAYCIQRGYRSDIDRSVKTAMTAEFRQEATA